MARFDTVATLRTEDAAAAESQRGALVAELSEADAATGAFLYIDHDASLTEGRSATGLLAGVPVALKDNLVTCGVATTAASRILEAYIPPYNATVVERLLSAGAVAVGKANLDEFAMGSSTENSAYQLTRNPFDLERIPGGSSGGSAAAVAAGYVPIALGSDTGGSIRQPAALCGVYGLKPTWGRVSRYGLIAFASSLDQVGPFARTAEDLALGLQVIAGPDPRDSTCALDPAPDYLTTLSDGVAGLRIGMPAAYFGDGLDPEVEDAVRAAVSALQARGAIVSPCHLPDPAACLAAYYVLAPAEASSNLARFDGIRYGHRARGLDLASTYAQSRGEAFGPEVLRRIILGTFALSSGYYDAYYGKAQRTRTWVRQQFDAAFDGCDLIVTPTSPVTAPRLGEKLSDPTAMYLMDVYTISANLAGLPAVSAPCGLSGDGLPIGVQFIGRAFEEGTLLRACAALEEALGEPARPKVAI